MLNKVKWFFISNLNTSYNFIYDKNVVGKAPKFAESLTRDKFLDLLVNLYSLAQADYVVCTFTSNLCRYVYELMQGQTEDDDRKIDASFRIKSLDNYFYVSSFNSFTKRAIMDHLPKNSDELELQKRDIIEFNC